MTLRTPRLSDKEYYGKEGDGDGTLSQTVASRYKVFLVTYITLYFQNKSSIFHLREPKKEN